MRVVHFSISTLAGVPIRLVQALRRHTDIEVSLVDLERWSTFSHDVVFAEERERAIELAEKADVIHLHNYLDRSSSHFAPIDFAELERRGARLVRHFVSHPATVARRMGIDPIDLHADSMPSIVLAQFQERFYPAARVVPNLIAETEPDYQSAAEVSGAAVLANPTTTAGAWSERWDTKAMPELRRILSQVRRRTGLPTRMISHRPHAELMREKARARIVIDDLVTGSYHLSALEGLAVGRPVLCYLDDRTLRVLRHISGSPDCPFLNVRLEDALDVILGLIEEGEAADEIGRAGRRWLEDHWSEATGVRAYVEVYEQLLRDPSGVVRQPELTCEDSEFTARAIVVPEAIHRARARQWFRALPPHLKLWTWMQRGGRAVRVTGGGFARRVFPRAAVKKLQALDGSIHRRYYAFRMRFSGSDRDK